MEDSENKRTMREGDISITSEEYHNNVVKYLEYSRGERQVYIEDDGKVVGVLGWGKLPEDH